MGSIDLQITALTPKGKEKASKKYLEANLLGALKKPKSRKILKGKIVWVIACKNEKELLKYIKRAGMADVGIKKFYAKLFRMFARANKLMSKGEKGFRKAKNWMLKLARKDKMEDVQAKLENISEEEFKEYIRIDDAEYMKKFLEQELIQLKRLDT